MAANVPASLRAIAAGTLEQMLKQACRQCDCDPAELLDWAVKPGQLVIIIPDGRKVRFQLARNIRGSRTSRQADV